MKKFEANFFRGNPQLANGGYETKRTFMAKNEKSAEKKAKEYEKDCVYGTMTLLELKGVA